MRCFVRCQIYHRNNRKMGKWIVWCVLIVCRPRRLNRCFTMSNSMNDDWGQLMSLLIKNIQMVGLVMVSCFSGSFYHSKNIEFST